MESFGHVRVERTREFADWLTRLRDREARARILNRIDRLERGNPGQTRSLGGGIVELKIDHGPGYRVYFIQRGAAVMLLLCGGDKSTQDSDIRHARAMAKRHDEEV